MLDHRLRAVSADVAHRNAPPGGGFEVDVVRTSRCQADEPEIPRGIDQLTVDAHLVGQHPGGVTDTLEALPGSSGIEELDAGQRVGKRRTVDSFRAHGCKIEKHGVHWNDRLFFAI